MKKLLSLILTCLMAFGCVFGAGAQDLPDVKITPKSFAEAVTSAVAGAGNIDADAFADFRNALEQIATAFSVPPKPPEEGGSTDHVS